MYELNIFFPGTQCNGSTHIRQEKMLLNSRRTSDILKALRSRGTLHSIDSQIDIEEDTDHSGGFLSLSDAITGDRIVSVMW